MKQRATVVCQRGTRILLVAKEHSRWSLPGGKPLPGEDWQDAALRELAEETGLRALRTGYLFDFTGVRTCHHVFAVQFADGQAPIPGNEITRCCWVKSTDIAQLTTSISTRAIVEILAMNVGRRPGRTHFALDADEHIRASGPL
ncbi:NUDIX hydrolase [Paraburkholderia sp. BCC1884]|uniref:NUDIX hydrolase n=1 Tax=Paraburkholderia sp. BCC1884 TaxID=2562668 RepID=UPI001183F92F|nr:NUDIX domain-containing protein [Paraburkholderia sp. BCC1884]